MLHFGFQALNVKNINLLYRRKNQHFYFIAFRFKFSFDKTHYEYHSQGLHQGC